MALFVLPRHAGSHSAFAGIGRSYSLHFVRSTILDTTVCLIRKFGQKMGLPRVFFDMSADGQPLGRIVIEVSRR